uniref:Rhodanese domain-containing protein n=1 Tax=Globodera rostochiensis TaxID=31243 RepID=A0A914HHS7_GLORO
MSFPLFFPLLIFLIPLIDCQRTPSRLTSVQTQTGPVPDPTRIADPSLLPVHLQKPDYRPLSNEAERKSGGPKPPMAETGETEGATAKTTDQEKASETVVNMGEGEDVTTEKPKDQSEEAQKQADAKIGEQTGAIEETQKKGKEAEVEEKANEAIAMEEEAKKKKEEAEEKKEEAEEKKEEAAVEKEEAKEMKEEAEEKKEEAEEKKEEAAEEKEEAKKMKEEAEEEKKKAEEEKKEAEERKEEAAEAEAASAEMPPASSAADERAKEEETFPEGAVAALADALRSAKLLVQNITLVVPGDSASLAALLNALIDSRSAVFYTANSPPAQPSQTNPTPSPRPPVFFDQPLINCRPITAPQFQFNPTSSATLPAPVPVSVPINPHQSNFLVDVEQLHGWIKSGQNVKVLDASYEPDPGTADHVQFYAEYYANWGKLIREKKGRQYERSHIPGAVPFNVNIATYPSWNERQALYPADKFEQYVQRLGIDRGDRLVVYSRGPLGGLLHAARVWFLLRTYGHEDVRVLDGGLDTWRRADLPANDVEVETKLGNWKAHFRPELVATFEELTNAESDGFCILSRLNWFNFLDVRPRNEFFGLVGPQPFGPQRNRLPGTKPFPADELVQDGLLAPPAEIIRKLQQIGYSRGYQTIAMGNTADEASLALLALGQVQDTRAKLFNGGMEEIRRRAPYLISKN